MLSIRFPSIPHDFLKFPALSKFKLFQNIDLVIHGAAPLFTGLFTLFTVSVRPPREIGGSPAPFAGLGINPQ